MAPRPPGQDHSSDPPAGSWSNQKAQSTIRVAAVTLLAHAYLSVNYSLESDASGAASSLEDLLGRAGLRNG